MRRQRCELIAFVYMPEHVHLLILPRNADTRMGNVLYAIKRPVSFRIKRLLEAARDPLLVQLTIRERPGKSTFRYWQEGGGYDRNITQLDTLGAVADYIHLNPVRRGLCHYPEDWKWSSFHYYEHPDEPVDPDLPQVHGYPS